MTRGWQLEAGWGDNGARPITSVWIINNCRIKRWKRPLDHKNGQWVVGIAEDGWHASGNQSKEENNDVYKSD